MRAVDRFAVDFFAVGLAVVALLVDLPVLFFAVAFLATDFADLASDLAVDLVVDFPVEALAVDFFAVGLATDLVAVLPAVDFAVDLVVPLAGDFAVDLVAVLFLAVDFFASAMLHPLSLSGRHALEASSFTLAHTTPYAIPLVAAQSVIQTLHADGAVGAYALRLARRPAFLGEEDFRIVATAECPLLPRNEVMHPSLPKITFV